MIWWILGAVAALVLATIGWALCAAGGQQDDAQGRGDREPDEPQHCSLCGGPCFNDPAGDVDEWRLP